MATHDIIDNRSEKLVAHLTQMLGTSERARFAVGHLFLSGFTSIDLATADNRETEQ
jgi:hypothetical protein